MTLFPLPPIDPASPWLAPLAGWSDLPFRLLCRENGAAVCCTEMVSAKGLVYERTSGGRATHGLLETAEGDDPLVVQLFGEDPQFMGRAVALLGETGIRYVDCNMGCSVPKVTRAGAGAALLREPDRALAVGRAMIREAEMHGARVGFKLRLGWDERVTGLRLARELEEAGASWLTIHPRTARQGFSGEAEWSAITAFTKALRIPVLASGDLWTAEDGVRCLRETGARAVMFARGALRDPAVFARYLALDGLSAGPLALRAEDEAPSVLHSRIRRHAALARQHSSHHTSLLKMRTAIPRYVRHLEGAGILRRRIIGCRSWEEFDEVLADFFGAAPKAGCDG